MNHCKTNSSQLTHVKRQLGFSLLEILVAVAIVAILASIALPAFSGLIRDIRTKSISDAVTASLQQARGEAIKSNGRVLVCPGDTTATDCASGTSWVNGWISCYDRNSDGTCDTSTTTLPNPFRVDRSQNTTNITVTASANKIIFTGTGGTTAAATVTVARTGSTFVTNIAATGLVKGRNRL